MKNSNIFFFKQLEKIEATLVAHDIRINERLDQIELKLLVEEPRYVTAALEEAVKKVAVRAVSIDQKVSDN